jgi:DNA-binding protein H-NS
MKLDLSELSLKELKQLKKDVAYAITNFESKRRREAIAELEAKAKEMGFASLSKLIGNKPAKRDTKRPVTPKYRHPEDTALQWSGRGRKPAWFHAALNAGISEKDMLIR